MPEPTTPTDASQADKPIRLNRRERTALLRHQSGEHDRHCFVVMPTGHTPSARKWFRGWYEVVIEPVVKDLEYEPILATAVDEPNAINDEIRTHLTFDSMVVVDLAGESAVDLPNPNVMYELGIRHALDKPVVIMAWEGQDLPFDISNQRALVGQRGFADLTETKEKLARFITAAKEGRFYRPMEAVTRAGTLDYAPAVLGPRSVMSALVQEVRDLRRTVESGAGRPPRLVRQPRTERILADVSIDKDLKKALQADFLESGGTKTEWSKFWAKPVAQIVAEDPSGWGEEAWRELVREQGRIHRAQRTLSASGSEASNSNVEAAAITTEPSEN
jgi:hypothetical protein